MDVVHNLEDMATGHAALALSFMTVEEFLGNRLAVKWRKCVLMSDV